MSRSCLITHSRLYWLLIGLSMLISVNLQGQSSKNFTPKLVQKFKEIHSRGQEKLYIHTDKPYYGATEPIFLRGYLVNASDLRESSLSNYLYVELRNRYDSIVIRKKLKRDSLISSGFMGSLELPPDLPPDQYTLCGYTHYMRNFETAYYYTRVLNIGNRIRKGIIPEIEYQMTDAGMVSAKMRFSTETKPLDSIVVACRLNGAPGELLHEWHARTNSRGEVSFEFEHNARTRRYTKPAVEVIFLSDGYNYKHTFHLPKLTNQYTISFFPEGGTFLSGTPQQIAFKAQHESGYAEEVIGYISNEQGDTLTHFASQHDGMGVFTVTAQVGETLMAHARSSHGVEITAPLPQAVGAGFALAIKQIQDQIIYQVRHASQTRWPDSLYVVAHTREQLRYCLSVSQNNPTGTIPIDVFNTGITHFILMTGKGVALSRRLVFIDRPSPVECIAESESDRYAPRQKARVRLRLQNRGDSTLHPAANLSVSITDRRLVEPDSLAGDILSTLLLTSDLKGYIHQPGYYFSPQIPDRKRAYLLDLVMLTHGWSRFETDSLFETSTYQPAYRLEKTQFVTGRVRNVLNQYIDEATVSLLGPKDEIVCYTYTDRKGYFVIDNLWHRDSSELILRASRKKGSSMGLEILIDRELPPLGVVDRAGYTPILPEIPRSYLDNVTTQFLDSGGQVDYYLKEVEVTASRPRPYRLKFEEEVVGYQSFTAKSLYRPQSKTLLDMLYSIPGMNYGHPRSGKSKDEPAANLRFLPEYCGRELRIFINEQPVQLNWRSAPLYNDYYILDDIPAEDVASIDFTFVRPSGLIDYSKGALPNEINALMNTQYGENAPKIRGMDADIAHEQRKSIRNLPQGTGLVMVDIELRCPIDLNRKKRFSLDRIRTLGYSQGQAFYEPRYDTPDQSEAVPRDTRSTIYWNPYIEMKEGAKGRVIEFYTSDQPRNYRISVAGFTSSGEPFSLEQDLW